MSGRARPVDTPSTTSPPERMVDAIRVHSGATSSRAFIATPYISGATARSTVR